MDPASLIDNSCSHDGFVTTTSLAASLGISRKAAYRHLVRAVRDGRLTRAGAARSSRYLPVVPLLRFRIGEAGEESVLRQVLATAAANVSFEADERSIIGHVLGAMVHNAIEHSHGTELSVRLDIQPQRIEFAVADDGIGAFASVRHARGLANDLEAAAELTKGKVTTMPARHSGEGIYFTARVADRFELDANRLRLLVDTPRDDFAILTGDRDRGTLVSFAVARPPKRTLEQVFAAHTEDFEFTKTRTIVRLFALGTDFVARSEARRLLAGLERFREILVDFAGVAGIGQGFADELFRVWARQHEGSRLVPINMCDPVKFFVERAERAREKERCS